MNEPPMSRRLSAAAVTQRQHAQEPDLHMADANAKGEKWKGEKKMHRFDLNFCDWNGGNTSESVERAGEARARK